MVGWGRDMFREEEMGSAGEQATRMVMEKSTVGLNMNELMRLARSLGDSGHGYEELGDLALGCTNWINATPPA